MSSFGRNLTLDHNLPLTLPILNIRGVGKAEQKKKRKKKGKMKIFISSKSRFMKNLIFLVRLNSDTLHSGLFSHGILMALNVVGLYHNRFLTVP